MSEQRPRLCEVEFTADDETAEWIFDQIAGLVHNAAGVIDPIVSLGPPTPTPGAAK